MMMIRKICLFSILILFVTGAAVGLAEDKEVLGVKFAGEKKVAGKTLTLNGVAYRKALVFVKVYAGGFYLENPTKDPVQAIESEQVKHFYLHYLTSKATAKKIREGFVELMEKCNPPELVIKHRADIDRHAAWFDKDMKPGKTSVTTYIPGKGLVVEYMGTVKGTIPGNEYARMYYRYIFGDKADQKMKKGYLGL